VTERVGPGGEVLTPLDETSVQRVSAELRRLDVQAVAVCLLHSFAYSLHERSLATVMNAGVMPAITTYVQRLQRRLSEADIAAPLLLMQSNGGVAGVA